MFQHKLVEIVGVKATLMTTINGSSSVIKCKSNSISFHRISLLSVCWRQVIKKVIKENERRLEEIVRNPSPAETEQLGEILIILSISGFTEPWK